jgi:hypothetical protein
MFWFIASDTKLTGNKVTGWAAGLTFIGSETIVGKSLVVNRQSCYVTNNYEGD